MSSFNVAAFFIGTESKMKLWDVLAMCLLLLSSVAARPLYQNTQPAKRTYFPSSYSDSASLSVEDEEPAFQRKSHNLQEISMEDQCKAHGMFLLSASVMWTLSDGPLNNHISVTDVLLVETYNFIYKHMGKGELLLASTDELHLKNRT